MTKSAEPTRLILLIEDNNDLAESLALLLEVNGYNVVTASNGDEGLAILTTNAERISLVLLDMHMPIKNGLEFRAEQLKIPLLADIPTVVMSADTVLSKLPGFAGVLPKPIDMDQLFQIVRARCDGS